MDIESESIDAIEACRTCGVYYMTTTNYLKPLFQSPIEYPEMMQIRLELAQWKLDISEHDGLPQYVCNTCLHEFLKIFKFRSACTETQAQLRIFYNMREKNLANIKIKTEVMDPDDEAPECNFIYIDDFSDGENDANITPFKVPHVPIKEELIEEAQVPCERITDNFRATKESRLTEGYAQSHAIESSQEDVPEGEVAPIVYASSHTPESIQAMENLSITAPVECKLCQHLSPNQDEHKQHLQRIHEVRDIECHICGKVFKNSTTSRFKFHLKWHTLNKHVKCPQCGFVCNSRAALKEHRRAVHMKINCKICGKGVLGKKMKSHLRQHEILNKISCEYCKESFPSNEEKETHIWQVHAQEEDTNETTNPENHDTLQQHYSEASNGEENGDDDEILHVELLCAHCDQTFTEQSDLIEHAKQEHRSKFQLQPLPAIKQEIDIEEEEHNITKFEDYDDDDNVNVPTNDNSQYNQDYDNIAQGEQEEHEPEQETEREEDDTNASRFSKYTEEDEDHEVYHSQTETTIDDESQEDLEYSSSFNESENDHLQSNTFACAKCPQTFFTIEQLRIHCQQHQQEQQQEQQENSPSKSKFICDICHKEFGLKFSLNRHLRKHAKVSSYFGGMLIDPNPLLTFSNTADPYKFNFSNCMFGIIRCCCCCGPPIAAAAAAAAAAVLAPGPANPDPADSKPVPAPPGPGRLSMAGFCSFPSNEEKETHIWQVHAQEEDTNETTNPENHDTLQQHYSEASNGEENGDDDEILHVELLCAHCDQTFTEQSDLIEHAKQEHRSKFQLQPLPAIKQEIDIEEEEHNITKFEDYDDDDNVNVPTNDNSQYNQDYDNIAQGEQEEHEPEQETEREEDDTNASRFSKYTEEDEDHEVYHSQTETTIDDESQEDLEYSSSFNESENDHLQSNTFACAKCPQTFFTIEQLRIHCQQHQQEQQQEQQENSPSKSKFICDICHKEFGLKFSLNRHLRKHAKVSS
ncbi:enhancer of variegation 3-9 [Musca autumnalis]|uniref:enhancer of variegation 3-9 n=1 Tax=Musca autumnalis TaxID=221902 RepID=UPI003CEDDBC7